MFQIDDAAALSALRDWTAAVGTYWNYFGVVSLGAVGFAASMRQHNLDKKARRMAVSAFVLFAAGNLVALLLRQRVLVAVVDAMNARGKADHASLKEFAKLFSETSVSSVWSVGAFHIAISTTVAFLIWFASAPRAEGAA